MNLLLQEDQVDHQAMEQELLKARQYVDMALQYRRLDQAGCDLVLKEYNLGSLVKKAVRQYAPTFIYSKTAVHLKSLKRAVLIDEKWFLFVLEQTLCNVIKYTRQGGIYIYIIGSEHMAISGDWAGFELMIEDNSIGIRREDIPRVFEWGYTGYNGRQEKRSTGIGLLLCRQAMEMPGQAIHIDPQEGEGMRVCLGLPGSLLKMQGSEGEMQAASIAALLHVFYNRGYNTDTGKIGGNYVSFGSQIFKESIYRPFRWCGDSGPGRY